MQSDSESPIEPGGIAVQQKVDKTGTQQRENGVEKLDEVNLEDEVKSITSITSSSHRSTVYRPESLLKRESYSSATAISPKSPQNPPVTSSSTNSPSTPFAAPPSRRLNGPLSWLRHASSSFSSASTATPMAPSLSEESARMPSSEGFSNVELLLSRIEKDIAEKSTEREHTASNNETDTEGRHSNMEEAENDRKKAEDEAGANLRANFESLLKDGRCESDADIDWNFWSRVVSDYTTLAKNEPKLLQSSLQQGIPPVLRGTIWQIITSSKNAELEEIYNTVLIHAEAQEGLDKAIRKDVARTFPKLDYFRETVGEFKKAVVGSSGQESLFNVCKSYGNYDPDVGYMQGIAFIAGPLLLQMPDDEAFGLLVRLMKAYNLRDFFISGTPGVLLKLFQFERLLEDYLPLVAIHLHRVGIRSDMYATQWFLTFFAYKFPMSLVLRIFDLVIAEGIESLLRFGIALMIRNQERILELTEFEKLLDFLKEELFESYKVAKATTTLLGRPTSEALYRVNELVNDACSISISVPQLRKYAQIHAAEMNDQQAREAEVANLKSANLALQARYKRLELELADLNREHIDVANEMVQTKMSLSRVSDENEVLLEQVNDLRDMVDRQPAEIEEKLKEEMGKILDRNEQVMTLNRDLEEQLGSMEKELAETKMSNATVCS